MVKQNKKSHHSTQKRKEMIEQMGVACKSIVVSELYTKLEKEKRLIRFISIVQYCSTYGYDMNKTIETLLGSMPGYLKPEELTEEIFNKLLENHVDVAEAWGYGLAGDNINNVMVKNRAFTLAMQSERIEDIRVYNEMYNQEIIINDDIRNADAKTTTFNFNLKK